jgi:hypothetical protein
MTRIIDLAALGYIVVLLMIVAIWEPNIIQNSSKTDVPFGSYSLALKP